MWLVTALAPAYKDARAPATVPMTIKAFQLDICGTVANRTPVRCRALRLYGTVETFRPLCGPSRSKPRFPETLTHGGADHALGKGERSEVARWRGAPFNSTQGLYPAKGSPRKIAPV